MRVIVCGGRTYADRDQVKLVLEGWPIGDSLLPVQFKGLRLDLKEAAAAQGELTIVHGGARGADTLAGEVAEELGYRVEVHPARWNEHGRAAGPIRNRHMLSLGAHLVVAFPGGRGTADMVRAAHDLGFVVSKVGPASAWGA